MGTNMKKILIFLIAIIFLIGIITNVSATTWTRIVDYNDEDIREVTFKNWWGLGREQGKMTLTSHELNTEGKIKPLQVFLGNQIVMYYDFEFNEDLKDTLKEPIFINMKDEKIVQRDWKFVYLINETITKDICLSWNEVDIDKNISFECNEWIKKDEIISVWKDYNSTDIPKGNIRIGIEVDVQIDDYIDGIWKVGSKEIDKHAIWTSGAITSYVVDGDVNYTVLTYLNDGTFNTTQNIENAWVLIVGGGGAGGTGYGGGGGAGELLNGTMNISIGNYGIVVGIGGKNGIIARGENSSFNGAVAWGGGNGTYYDLVGVSGGSGSGGGGANSGGQAGGVSLTGTVPTGMTHYGNTGGTANTRSGGGGGGAGAVGTNGVANLGGGIGGDGLTISINGTAYKYAYGGTGSIWEIGTFYANEPGGAGARDINNTLGSQGWNGTGSGGGGGAIGGTGVVIIRYLIPPPIPTVTSLSPIDYYNSTSSEINFLVNISSVTPVNVSLEINGSVVSINDTGIFGNYTFTETLGDGYYSWKSFAYSSDGFLGTGTTKYLTIDTTPFIEFLTPDTLVNYANITQEYIPMQVNVSTDYFENISYDLYNINGTTFNLFYETETFNINFTNMPDAHYHYNVTVCTTTDQCNVTETRHLNHDTLPPILADLTNLTDLTVFSLPTNSTWSYTASDPHLDQCYYNTSEQTTPVIITCNSTVGLTEWATDGNKTVQYCANDTFGLESCNTEYIWVYYISYTQSDLYDPIAEGMDQTFILNVSLDDIPTTIAYLNFNGSTYLVTGTDGGDYYYFSKDLNIPTWLGNSTGSYIDWYWNFDIDGVTDGNVTTSTENLTVYDFAIDDCSSYKELILNISLFDEKLGTLINETAGSNFEIDLRLTSKDNSSVYLDYAKTWTDDNNPQVCLPLNVLNNSQYWIDFTIGFSSTDRVWEFYYLDDGTLNATKIFDARTNWELDVYNLLTDDSTSFLFNYFDQDGLSVDNAMIHVYRKYIGEGEFKEVERAKTDENGDTIVHLVEEDVIYYFVITQYGVVLYTSNTYTALCQATPCTIQISASGESAVFPTDWDLIDGGGFTLFASSSTRVVNLTYAFDTLKTVNLTVYKYASDGSYTTINSSSDTGTSGSIIMTVPQSAGNVSFFASVYVDNKFIRSDWVDFESKFGDSISPILALFLASLIILSLGLMAVSEGTGTIIFVILGVAVAGFLGLISTRLSPTVNILTYLIVAGLILIIKLSRSKQ